MSDSLRSKEHWEEVYRKKQPTEVSWYQPHLEKSFELILETGIGKEASIIDIGGGTSTLPDDLLDKGFKNITVLDISPQALKVSKDRLGNQAARVHWIIGDVTEASLKPDYYDFWHDRAVFHFLTKSEDRQSYIERLTVSLKSGGYLLMATFGPNGPTKCSGLEIIRYSPESLQKEIGKTFHLKKHIIEIHKTPFDTAQEFLYCLFRKM